MTGLTQLIVKNLVFMSWRAVVGGEAISCPVRETVSAGFGYAQPASR